MADLEGFADQGIPLLADLGDAAPALGRLIQAQGTLADASRVALPSLGDALERGRPALMQLAAADQGPHAPRQAARARLGRPRPAHESLDQTGGLERINDFLYYSGLSDNGFDEHRPLPARRPRDQPLLDLQRDARSSPLVRRTSSTRRGCRRRLGRERAAQRHRLQQAGGSVAPLNAMLRRPARRGRRAPRAGASASATSGRCESAPGAASRRRSVKPSPRSITCSGLRRDEPAPLGSRAYGEPGAGGGRDRCSSRSSPSSSPTTRTRACRSCPPTTSRRTSRTPRSW